MHSYPMLDDTEAGTRRVGTMANEEVVAGPVQVAHWQRRLADLASKYNVPGAVLGISRAGQLLETAHGVLSTATGVEATVDSLFQIGSISKVWTATVVMRLVDQGRLDLDAPIIEVLPELRLSSQQVTARLTMRHLLCHTSGIDGDVFIDTGRGDDCLERYVERLADADQIHPLGATMSYCNSGFILAGRVVERVTGLTWDAALRMLLIEPLGLTQTVTLPEDVLRFRAAVGHVSSPGEMPAPASVWQFPRSVGPAGLISATARDVLAFARMHLSAGRCDNGTLLLSESSALGMQQSQVTLPDPYTNGAAWGLGWILYDWDGHRVIGHDGNTIGQSAYLRILPEFDLAVTLLCNGGRVLELYDALFREIFRDIARVGIPPRIESFGNVDAPDLTPHVGVYERAGHRLECFVRAGELVLTPTTTGALAQMNPQVAEELVLTPVCDGLFVTQREGSDFRVAVTFYSLDDGSRYVHLGLRATPKVA